MNYMIKYSPLNRLHNRFVRVVKTHESYKVCSYVNTLSLRDYEKVSVKIVSSHGVSLIFTYRYYVNDVKILEVT